MAAAKLVVLICLFAVSLCINPAASDTYTNHTVGGDAGWFFDPATNKTSADYTAWAANQTFNLGDYLIFNTTTNQTVIQSYNKTTYDSCNTDDALDSDTFEYDGGSYALGLARTIAVPLTIKGTQYYFSDASDGEQCQNGMAFEIKVNQGLGLPPSLNQPPPPAYVPPPVPAAEGQSPVVTTTTPNGGMKTGANLCWLAFMLLVLRSFLA